MQARRASYEHVIRETLREFETGLLPDGRLPYWARGTEANDFVTIQTAWCVNQAERAGFDVPERLSTELAGALEKMVSAQMALSPSLRAFAIFALSEGGGETSDIGCFCRDGAFSPARQTKWGRESDAGDCHARSRA